MSDHYDDVLSTLQQHYSSVERYYGHTVYKLSKDGFAYLRYSSKSVIGKKKRVDKYFFGIETDTIEKLNHFDFAVILICGNANLTFVIGKDAFLSIINDVPVTGSQWKLNVFCSEESDELQVTGKPRINISGFKNQFESIFSKIIYLEKRITKEEFRQTHERPKVIQLSESESLRSNLISTSVKSDEPGLFEEAIACSFRSFGFESEHVGGPGNTDVLISSPYRVIIEAKTTTRDSIGKIYFTRLKQHKEKNRADFIVVICNDFAPSVGRDAEIEQSLLIRTELLCRLLDLNEQYPLSPFDLESLFEITGLLKEEHLRDLAARPAKLKGQIGNLPAIVQSIDNEKRSLDEVFGRYQMRCTQLSVAPLEKTQFNAVIDFLAMRFIGVIVKESSLYCREVAEDIAVRRLSKIGGAIYETTK